MNQSIEAPASQAGVLRMIAFADEVEQYNQLSLERSYMLRLVIEEIGTNIVKYGYPQDAPGVIQLQCAYDKGLLRVIIRDCGRPFDPREYPDPDMSAGIAIRPIGGLGLFLVRASVDNSKGLLRPNQYVRARVHGAIRPKAILVPQRAVQQGGKGSFVWIVDKENKVQERPVTVGPWHGDEWFISEGVQTGEQVVVDGALTLSPGAQVQVASYTGKAATPEMPVQPAQSTKPAAAAPAAPAR